MTKKFQVAVMAATAALTFGSAAAQAAPFTANADAKAKVLKQISVTKAADLDFGTIVVGIVAGTVAIAADSTRTCDPALTCSGTVSSAAFDISGSKNEAVTISSDTSVTLVNADDATETMTASLASSSATATLSTTGTASFNVGGTLSVAANQLDGAYLGNFDVTVDYQ